MKLHQTTAEKWVLQICERTYRRNNKIYEVWQTISQPLSKLGAMARCEERHHHKKPHRILTGVREAMPIHSKLVEVVG